MRDKKLIVFGIASVIIFIAVLLLFLNQTEKGVSGVSGIESIEFEATDINGEPIDSSIFKNYKITMINIWGTFCGPCIEEMPDIQMLYEEVEPQNINVIGIISDIEDPEIDAKTTKEAKRIIEQAKVSYQNVIPDKIIKSELLTKIQGVPTTIFVDSNGQVIGEVTVGSRSMQEYKAIIDDLLESSN